MVKMRKVLAAVLCAVMIAAVMPAIGAGAATMTKPSVGDGSEESPYEIGTAAELLWFANRVNNYLETSLWAVLTADVAVNPGTFNSSGSYTAYASESVTEWTPIGSESYPYTGTFDGQSHTISGLYFKNEEISNVGLFGCIENATIKNVNVANSYLRGDWYVGGIVGSVWGYSENEDECAKIINCGNSAAIKGYWNVGGIAGYSDGIIEECVNYGSIISDEGVAGIVCTSNGIVNNCYNAGTVTNDCVNQAGGIAVYGNKVTNCYNIGIVSAEWGSVSSISVDGNVVNCYYLKNTAFGEYIANDGKDYGTSVTAEMLASGEVAYLLQQGQEEQDTIIWGQEIGSEDYPSLYSRAVFYNSDDDTYYNLSSIAFENTSLTLTVGDSAELGVLLSPSSVQTSAIKWSSSNSFVASVTSSGTVRAVGAGYAVITAAAGGLTAYCLVTVTEKTVNVIGVALDKTSLTLEAGETAQLTAEVFPEEATNTSVTWESSDERVATVADGVVTAVAGGSAVITVTTSDGGYAAQCSVTVTEEEAEKADISVGSVTARAGDEVTVPIEIENNPGIAGFNFVIDYDNTLLTPVSISLGSDLTIGTLTSNIQQGGDMTQYEYVTALWYNPSNFTNDGEILLVTFAVADDAEEGDIPISLSYEVGDVTNQVYDNIGLNITNGKVSVTSTVTGDVYGDGEVNTKDVVRLSQYLSKWNVELSAAEIKAADIVSDGEVNTKDIVKLSQYLSKWNVEMQSMSLMGMNLFESGTLAFEVGSVEAAAGEYVDVPVYITENGGVAGFNVQLNYDNTLLTPVSITQGEALGVGSITSNIQQGGDMTRHEYVTALWYNPSNITTTGLAFTVRFLVAEDAEGEIALTLTYDENDVPCDQSYNELDVAITNGVITLGSVAEADDYTINSLTGEIPTGGGSFYAEVNVTKNSDRDAVDVIVIALYKDGEMIDKTYMKANLAKGQTVTFGGKLTGVEGAEIKAFVWDGFDTMVPLANSLTK
ncbi:MAG: Ig-like domain-containing protein [Clostridia bacterium]|nr:Ig-like domain-containing protein [Clostridia bacterium]